MNIEELKELQEETWGGVCWKRYQEILLRFFSAGYTEVGLYLSNNDDTGYYDVIYIGNGEGTVFPLAGYTVEREDTVLNFDDFEPFDGDEIKELAKKNGFVVNVQKFQNDQHGARTYAKWIKVIEYAVKNVEPEVVDKNEDETEVYERYIFEYKGKKYKIEYEYEENPDLYYNGYSEEYHIEVME